MAKIELTNVEVARVNRNGFGVQVLEIKQSGEKVFRQRYTVWFTEPHGLTEGDVVSVKGVLGAKVGEPWVDKQGVQRHSVELSVNFPVIENKERNPSPQSQTIPFVDEPF